MMKSTIRTTAIGFASRRWLFSAGLVAGLAVAANCPAYAQGGIGEGDLGACTLTNHVYSCNAAEFQKELAGASTVSLETHNPDGIARKELKQLAEDKLHKTVVPDGSPADMVFLLEPIDVGGQVFETTSLRDLGTLRVYSTSGDGRPGHLLWAETYSSDPTNHDLPWAIVAHGLVTKFEKRFQIK